MSYFGERILFWESIIEEPPWDELILFRGLILESGEFTDSVFLSDDLPAIKSPFLVACKVSAMPLIYLVSPK